jgi:hypothetical protein
MLQGRKPMTSSDICRLSGFPRRTVYAALRTLRERGALMQRLSLHDTRQTYFWLAGNAGIDPVGRIAAETSAPSVPTVHAD